MKLKLQRDAARYTGCTLGTLTVEGWDLVLQTIERPWIPSAMSKSGEKGISCISPGLYHLERHSSEAHPKTWALVNPSLDVIHWPDAGKPFARTAVLIHPANWATELRGCIAPGLARTRVGLQWMVQNSREAMSKIMGLVSWTDDHQLEIS